MGQDPEEQDDSAADDGPMSVPDEDLPEDLQPAEDNPLAQPAGDDVPDDVLTQDAGHGDGDTGEDPEGAPASGDDDAAGGTASSSGAPSGAG